MAKAGRPKKIATPEVAPTETKVTVKDGFYTQVSPNLYYYNLGKGILLKYQIGGLHAIETIPDDIIPEDNFKQIAGSSTQVLNVPSGSVILESTLNAISLKYVAQTI